MTKKITGYQERKAAGLCVRTGCDEKPEKNADGTRRSYCATHNAMNAKNSAAWAARQGKTPKVKVAKVQKVKAAKPGKVVGTVKVPGIGTIELVEALKPVVTSPEDFGAQVTALMEKRGCSRKIAAQFLRRRKQNL